MRLEPAPELCPAPPPPTGTPAEYGYPVPSRLTTRRYRDLPQEVAVEWEVKGEDDSLRKGDGVRTALSPWKKYLLGMRGDGSVPTGTGSALAWSKLLGPVHGGVGEGWERRS